MYTTELKHVFVYCFKSFHPVVSPLVKCLQQHHYHIPYAILSFNDHEKPLTDNWSWVYTYYTYIYCQGRAGLLHTSVNILKN